MKCSEWNYLEREVAVEWESLRIGRAFPYGWLPGTGLVCRDDNGIMRGTLAVYLDSTSPVAVLGWLIVNPDNTPRESDRACRALIRASVDYAKLHGAEHLLTIFGHRGINHICDDLGFYQGDKGVEHKYLPL